jgi:hypothetical protein
VPIVMAFEHTLLMAPRNMSSNDARMLLYLQVSVFFLPPCSSLKWGNQGLVVPLVVPNPGKL